MTDNAINLSGVTRRFGSVTALDEVTTSIKTGQICGLLGSNGAGKTTLMSLIAGHDQPTAGRVEVHGKRPFESAAVAAQTCFIRDNQRYPDDYKLTHALRIAPAFHPHWDSDYAQELAENFRLPTKTDTKKFSRGQLSALAITMTLASRAPITIFDEPYLGLDVSARHKFYEVLIEDYTRHPRTIVLSTHLVGEMQSIFDHVIVLHHGKVHLDAAADDLQSLGYEVSGRAETVRTWANENTAMTVRAVGSLATATFAGPVPSSVPAGLEVRDLPLHDLVAAIGDNQQGVKS